MSSTLKNLSEPSNTEIPSAEKLKFGIVVSEWNPEITEALYNGAMSTLLQYKASESNINRINVPGSFELTFGAQYLGNLRKYDAIICLGCVIQGETKHFDFICNAVANGITNVSIALEVPIVFGVLTTNDHQQAVDRSGGKHGNKGVEAAITAIKMASMNSF